MRYVLGQFPQKLRKIPSSTLPEHEHENINSSEYPSWQILQKRPDEFLLTESVILSLATDEDILGDANGNMVLRSVRGASSNNSFSIPVL